jgi:hypothetical protein
MKNRIKPTTEKVNALDLFPDFSASNNETHRGRRARKTKDELQVLLKGIILGRIQNKHKYAEEFGINQLMHDIRDTQMAIETELEAIREIKKQSSHSNNFSALNVKKSDL